MPPNSMLCRCCDLHCLRNRKLNIVLGKGQEMFPRHRKLSFTAKCLNTFVAHCRCQLGHSEFNAGELPYYGQASCPDGLLVHCRQIWISNKLKFNNVILNKMVFLRWLTTVLMEYKSTTFKGSKLFFPLLFIV